jgi:hypothetical protein
VALDRPRQRNSPEFLKLRSDILELLHFTGNAAENRPEVDGLEQAAPAIASDAEQESLNR